MTESNKIRYSTRGVLLFLLSLALLGAMVLNLISVSGFIKNNNIFQGRNWGFHNFVDKSLYNDANSEMDFLKYYIRAEKITNYPMTEDYQKTQPNTIVAQEVSGEYEYFQSREEFFDRSKYEYFVKSNIDGYEEPIYGVNYLTNDWVFLQNYGEDYKFDPSTMKFKEGNVKTSGTWTTNSFKMDNISRSGAGEEYNLHKDLNEAIKAVYTEIKPSTNGITKLDFSYVMDVNSPNLNQYMERQILKDNYIPIAFMVFTGALLIVVAFGFVTDFETAKEAGFYKSISNFPIEIVIILTGILSFFLVLGVELFSSIDTYNFRGLLLGILILAIFFGGIAVLYTVYALKSIYKKGFGSFVFQNGILYRAVKSVYNKGRNRVIGVTNNLEGTSKKNALLIYGSLILLGFMGTRWFVDYRQNFVFILWVLLVTAIGAFLKKYFEDIKAIESASKFLAEGYYDVKVDENDTRFRTLAHNLNTVRNNLDSAVEDAIKSERLKTELITNVSHDLKTPLTSIINYSELIVNEDENMENIKEYAKVINEKSHRLKELIEGLFDLSKASSKNIDLNIEEIDLGQLIEQIYGEWEDILTEKNITTNLNRPEEPVIIELDGTQTSRILENLFSNIYKYALENTRVYVDLFKEDNRVKLVIKNISKYPLNISPEELMERFTRGDESRTTEGSGIGLSIASSLTEIQGGEFFIEIDGDLFKTTIVF